MEAKLEEKIYKERLVIAPFWWRVGAYLVDLLFICFLAWDLHNHLPLHAAFLRFLCALVAVHVLYEFLSMLGFSSSVGKLVFHLRVLDFKSLDKPPLLARLKRCALKEILLFFPLGYCFKDKFGRTFHDKHAQTFVIVFK
ncbi:RDD family protein [Helicobacter heilmannii]|uniref:RDD family protein n=1 Tax=Helicobacter heilmannii TaxID=35817 RepID=UPI000CF02046|nr:RDD family protein [Helicobacter heilmannii]